MKCTAWILVLSILSFGANPAAAAQTVTVQQQLQAMQRELRSLEKRNAEQQLKIDRLEHRFPRVVAARHPKHAKVLPKTLVFAPSTFASNIAKPDATTGANVTTPPVGEPGARPSSPPLGQPAPQQNSVKAVLQEQNALFQKGFTVTPQLTYTYADNRFFTLNGFLALGAIFLGNINVSRQQNNVVTPSLNVTYGATKRLQYDVTVPFVARTSTYTSAGADSSSSQASEKTISNAGIGDITFGAYYQLRQKSLNAPNVIVNAHITAPTGQNPYGIKIAQDKANNNLSYARTLPTGSGVWSLSAGATVIKQLDPAIVFGSVGYYYNLPGHFNDISPTDGTKQPGDIAPGNALSVSVGTAFALNDRISTSFSFQDTLVASTRERIKGPWVTVPGSSVNAGMFNIGATYAVNKKVSFQTMLGIGVTHDAPNFQFSVRIPHSFP